MEHPGFRSGPPGSPPGNMVSCSAGQVGLEGVHVFKLSNIFKGSRSVNPHFQPAHLDDVVLPRFGLVFFNHLIGEYDSFTDRANCDSAAYNKAGDLKEVYLTDSRPLTWGDLTTLECLLLKLRTGEELRERFWAIETRYADVAPSNFSIQHAKLSESDIERLSDDKLRARIEVIACEFFRLCMLAACREEMRKRASRNVSLAMLVFVVLCFVPRIVFLSESKMSYWTLSGVLFTGAMGGFISAQRRIQGVTDRGESLIDLIELSQLSGNLLAPIAGAVFAVVLYMMFAASFLKGPFFPELVTDSTRSPNAVFSTFFSAASGPSTGIDAAKLLIWCFIAGFAERFVPNALDRFILNSEKRKIANNSG
jgi:hypothetical protein